MRNITSYPSEWFAHHFEDPDIKIDYSVLPEHIRLWLSHVVSLIRSGKSLIKEWLKLHRWKTEVAIVLKNGWYILVVDAESVKSEKATSRFGKYLMKWLETNGSIIWKIDFPIGDEKIEGYVFSILTREVDVISEYVRTKARESLQQKQLQKQ
jgi:hypothetical protein